MAINRRTFLKFLAVPILGSIIPKPPVRQWKSVLDKRVRPECLQLGKMELLDDGTLGGMLVPESAMEYLAQHSIIEWETVVAIPKNMHDALHARGINYGQWPDGGAAAG